MIQTKKTENTIFQTRNPFLHCYRSRTPGKANLREIKFEIRHPRNMDDIHLREKQNLLPRRLATILNIDIKHNRFLFLFLPINFFLLITPVGQVLQNSSNAASTSFFGIPVLIWIEWKICARLVTSSTLVDSVDFLLAWRIFFRKFVRCDIGRKADIGWISRSPRESIPNPFVSLVVSCSYNDRLKGRQLRKVFFFIKYKTCNDVFNCFITSLCQKM